MYRIDKTDFIVIHVQVPTLCINLVTIVISQLRCKILKQYYVTTQVPKYTHTRIRTTSLQCIIIMNTEAQVQNKNVEALTQVQDTAESAIITSHNHASLPRIFKIFPKEFYLYVLSSYMMSKYVPIFFISLLLLFAQTLRYDVQSFKCTMCGWGGVASSTTCSSKTIAPSTSKYLGCEKIYSCWQSVLL